MNGHGVLILMSLYPNCFQFSGKFYHSHPQTMQSCYVNIATSVYHPDELPWHGQHMNTTHFDSGPYKQVLAQAGSIVLSKTLQDAGSSAAVLPYQYRVRKERVWLMFMDMIPYCVLNQQHSIAVADLKCIYIIENSSIQYEEIWCIKLIMH